MATRQRNLFLYLALACFIGITAIFIVDGYMGVYDTIYITTGEQEQKIEPDFWLQGNYPWTTSVNQGEKVFFRYEVDNRRLSAYSANIDVSVWRMQQQTLNVVSQPISVAPFAKEQVEWVIDTAELTPGDIPPDQSYQFSISIVQGETEKRVILYINPSSFPRPIVPTR